MVVGLIVMMGSCEQNTAYKAKLDDPETFLSSMKKLSDVIVYDIFSPPVASRIYVYPSIAAYEIIAQSAGGKYNSLAGQLNGLETVPQADSEVNYNLAAIHAFLVVGKALIFSEQKIDDYQESLYEDLKNDGLSTSELKNAMAFGEKVAAHVLEWADKDMYKQTRTYPKYSVRQVDSLWKPTPPDYMEGIEPHWREIRTLGLDSAEQFPPIPPDEFDLTEGSIFQKQLAEVYEVTTNLTEEQTQIAQFWDCNPYVSHHRGHAMFATKKITPGGHWIGITAIANRMRGSSMEETIESYALVSIALFDAFISCWDEKWKSVVVRPETLINQYMDEEWLPLLQTPPFPEYTSGHSVISRAAAVTLTDLFGEKFAFTDTTEVEYGLAARDFESFIDASEEAAVSRLYGGIHYMMAIENGVDQGERVGEYLVSKLKTRKEETTAGLD